MSKIDEKALDKVFSPQWGYGKENARALIEAYEAAKSEEQTTLRRWLYEHSPMAEGLLRQYDERTPKPKEQIVILGDSQPIIHPLTEQNYSGHYGVTEQQDNWSEQPLKALNDIVASGKCPDVAPDVSLPVTTKQPDDMYVVERVAKAIQKEVWGKRSLDDMGLTGMTHKRISHEAARAAISAMPKRESGWQPIETAPKDGIHILAGHNRVPSHVEQVYWSKGFDGWSNGAGIFAPGYFTHWQPMPDLNQIEGGSDA